MHFPVFPCTHASGLFVDAQVELAGQMQLTGELPLESALQSIVAESQGVILTMVEVASYDLLYDKLQSRSTRRQDQIPFLVQYKVWTTMQNAESLLQADDYPSNLVVNISRSLALIGTQTAVLAVDVKIFSIRNPGEIWEEENGVFVIKACPKGKPSTFLRHAQENVNMI